jgi:hypothetical protein
MSETTKSPCEFRTEAGLVVQRLQAAIGNVIRSVAGARIDRAARLGDELDLASGLAWKIFKSAESEDPHSAAQYLPGAAGMRIFLEAARKRKVSVEVIAQAQESFAQFEELVRRQAGSRKSFDMIMAGQCRQERERAELIHRKGAFEHLSFIWGVQAKSIVRTYVLQAAADGLNYDAIAIRGFVDLRRLRPTNPWCMSRVHCIDDAGQVRTSFAREPLDPKGAAAEGSAGLPLLLEFCSDPSIRFQCIPRQSQVDDFLLVDQRIGNAGLVTCFSGELLRAAEPRYRDPLHADLVFMPSVQTPCETFLLDIIAHRELFGRLQFEHAMYSDAGMRNPTEQFHDWEKLPLFERPEHLGAGLAAMNATEVPRYPEMLRYAFDRAGWNAAEFDLYRLRIHYPPIPVTATMTHPLPEQPAKPQAEECHQ